MCHPLAADQQAERPPLEGRPASGSRGGASCGRAPAGSPGAQQPKEQVHAKLQLVDLAGSECAGEPRAGALSGVRGDVGVREPAAQGPVILHLLLLGGSCLPTATRRVHPNVVPFSMARLRASPSPGEAMQGVGGGR